MLNQLLWLGSKVECTVGLSKGFVRVEGERDGRLNHHWIGTAKERIVVSVCVCVCACACVCVCVCVCAILHVYIYHFNHILEDKVGKDSRLITLILRQEGE